MINTFKETIISMADSASHVSKISGKKRNKAIIVRWANRGVAGVKLRTIQIGSEIFTSKEALNEFLNAVRQAKQRNLSAATSEGIRKTKIEAENNDQVEMGDKDQSDIEEEALELGI